MIFGDCPYEDCDGVHVVNFAGIRVFQKLICEHCNREYWMLHSRVEPEAYTPDELAKEYEIDEETKTLKTR